MQDAMYQATCPSVAAFTFGLINQELDEPENLVLILQQLEYDSVPTDNEN